MANPLLTELPYYSDSARLFEAVANRPWAVFLDSGQPATQQGRYDFISADPMAVLVTPRPHDRDSLREKEHALSQRPV